MIQLLDITNCDDMAQAADMEAPALEPIEGLEGWYLSSYTASRAGVDCIILACDGGAVENPLHSGGDVNWLGYVAEGSLELILGNSKGEIDSRRKVSRGDYLLFAPETYHGWIPGEKAAKLMFIKLK